MSARSARAIEHMLIELGPHGQRAWDLLDRITDDSLSLGGLYDAYRHCDLAGLRERLSDVDIEMHINGWRTWLGDRVRPDTVTHYPVHLRTLIPEGKPYARSLHCVDGRQMVGHAHRARAEAQAERGRADSPRGECTCARYQWRHETEIPVRPALVRRVSHRDRRARIKSGARRQSTKTE